MILRLVVPIEDVIAQHEMLRELHPVTAEHRETQYGLGAEAISRHGVELELATSAGTVPRAALYSGKGRGRGHKGNRGGDRRQRSRYR